jgi:hypothetical protein
MAEPSLVALLLAGFDVARDRLDLRLVGLTEDEYFWRPVSPAWSIQDSGGRWIADWADPDPDPAPVTTIAWRLWHVASDALAGYLDRSPGGRPLEVRGLEWHGDVPTALRDLRTACDAFRRQMADFGDEGLGTPLGPAWGPFAEGTWADLFVHAIDELTHHGAEIALLRDLYLFRFTAPESEQS